MLRVLLIAVICHSSVSVASEPVMHFPAKSWAVVSPGDEGLDAERLAAAVELLKSRVGPDGVRELVICRRGRIVWHGDNIDHQHGIWSCTKSFTSTCLGLLIADGRCSLDTKAADLIPALRERYPRVTLRHFTTMSSGYRAVGDAEAKGGYLHGPSRTPFDPAEPLFPPGEKFAYWDSAMNMFGLCLTAAAGEPLDELLKRKVMDPIDADAKKWKWGDRGRREIGGKSIKVNSGSGNSGGHVQISARELARFGHLMLNRGTWNGRKLIPSDWIDQATRVQVPSDRPNGHPPSDIPGSGVYGFNWWINGKLPSGAWQYPDAPRSLYLASGHNNNRLWIIPEWEMVIVRLGQDQANRKLTLEAENEFLKLVGEAVKK